MTKKIFLMLSIGLMAIGCAQLNPKRDVAQVDIKKEYGGETGNPLIGCDRDLEKELDIDAISQKFSVRSLKKIQRGFLADAYAKPRAMFTFQEKNELVEACNLKVKMFSGECTLTKNENTEVVAGPVLTENFVKSYRNFLFCNHILKCQEKSVFNSSVSRGEARKLQEIYEAHNCQ